MPVFPIFCTLFCQLEMEIVGLILHFLLLNSNLEWHTFYSTFWIPTFLTKIWFSRVFSRIFLESCWISSLRKSVVILVTWIKTHFIKLWQISFAKIEYFLFIFTLFHLFWKTWLLWCSVICWGDRLSFLQVTKIFIKTASWKTFLKCGKRLIQPNI